MQRRKILLSAALISAGIIVGGASSCSTTPTQPPTVDPAVLDIIKKATATVCNAIPMAETLAAIVAAGFPAAAGVTTITTAVAEEIAKLFCQQVAPSAAKVGSKLSATVNSKVVELHGFVVKDGKLVEF